MSIEIKLAHSLLKGSQEFIHSAVQYSKSKDSNSWRFAVIHLLSALELVFKSRLADEHWSLIFNDIDKANFNKIQDGDFLSTDIPATLIRLKNVVNIELPSNDRVLIKDLNKIRNKLIHFHMKLDENSIRSLLAKGLNLYIDFYNCNIAPNWDTYSALGYELSNSLKEFKAFLQYRLESLSEILTNANRPKTNYFWECAICLQDTIVISDLNLLKCLFCGNIIELEDYAKLLSKGCNVKSCSMCNSKAFIQTSNDNKNENYECIICGHYVGEPVTFCDIDGNKLSHLRSFKNM